MLVHQLDIDHSYPWLCYLESCPSTNTWAIENIDALDRGTVVFTHRQTAGRGQSGRTWYAPPGTITSSFICKQIPTNQLTGMSLIVGLAVIYAVEDLIPSLRDRLGLKWPNDVLLGERKLAGILCEGVTNSAPECTDLVVGIGLNHATDFTQLPVRASVADDLGKPISLKEIGEDLPTELALLERMRHYLLQAIGLGELSTQRQQSLISAFLPALNDRDTLRDREISLELLTEKVTGIAAGITERGELLIRLPDGQIRPFASGRVLWNTQSIGPDPK